MLPTALPCIAMGACPLPRDLAPKVGGAKDGITEALEVVAGRRVTVEIQAARRFEDAAQLEQADGHHAEVGLHPLAVR